METRSVVVVGVVVLNAHRQVPDRDHALDGVADLEESPEDLHHCFALRSRHDDGAIVNGPVEAPVVEGDEDNVLR
jgi:hypothetical protein